MANTAARGDANALGRIPLIIGARGDAATPNVHNVGLILLSLQRAAEGTRRGALVHDAAMARYTHLRAAAVLTNHRRDVAADGTEHVGRVREVGL